MPYHSFILYHSTYRLLYLPNPLKGRFMHIHISTLINPPRRWYSFLRIDPHHCRIFIIVYQLLHHIADSWDSCSRSYLEYYYLLVFAFPQKIIVIFLLSVWSLRHPLPVIKHKYIWSYYLPAFITYWYIFTPHLVVVNFRNKLIFWQVLTTTLKMVDTAMYLKHSILIVVWAKEVTVDVGSYSKYIVIIFIFIYLTCYLLQHTVAFVRIFWSVHLQSWAIETPEKMRICSEEIGIGTLHEVELAPVRRIVIPKSLIAPEIRQSRINTHTSPCPHHNHRSLPHKSSCLLYHRFLIINQPKTLLLKIPIKWEIFGLNVKKLGKRVGPKRVMKYNSITMFSFIRVFRLLLININGYPTPDPPAYLPAHIHHLQRLHLQPVSRKWSLQRLRCHLQNLHLFGRHQLPHMWFHPLSHLLQQLLLQRRKSRKKSSRSSLPNTILSLFLCDLQQYRNPMYILLLR